MATMPPAASLSPLDAAAVAGYVAEFDGRGFIVLPLLTPPEVAGLRRAFAADRESHPASWTLRGKDSRGGPTGESGRWQSGDVLKTDPDAFGPVSRHPRILQLVQALIGPPARFRGTSAMWREPVLEPPPPDVPASYAAQVGDEGGTVIAPHFALLSMAANRSRG